MREARPPPGKRKLDRARPNYVLLAVKITPQQKRALAVWSCETGRSEGEIIREILDRPGTWVRGTIERV